ncbi:unannotated protein [freshwater metagenome]|uniref:Unannotated protein n=1 Tax=freshwater metagenome TaxID=449393 RepID=A0A6J7FQC6_9ZZZZ
MPTSPQSTSAQALPKVDSAPRADGSPQGAGMAAPRSTGPDTSVRASNTTRARMARAIDRTTATNPSGRKRKRRSGPKVNTSTLARGRKLAPLLAMIFVGGLAVVTALPANAEFQNSSSVVAITNSHDLVVDASQTPKFLPGQSLEASSGALAASRDGVSATTLRTSFGGYTSASYVNNPNGTIQWPFSVTVPISDLFGWRIPPCNWCSADHKGVDFDAGEGYPIQIVADGVVTKVHPYDDNGDGMYVIITHDVNGLKFDSMYCHLLPGTIMVAEGQAVKVTQIVAQVGDTGASTGAHLHFEIHVNGAAIDPFAWLTEHAN